MFINNYKNYARSVRIVCIGNTGLLPKVSLYRMERKIILSYDWSYKNKSLQIKQLLVLQSIKTFSYPETK